MTPGGCPKQMAFGPCGGVTPDGSCEVTPEPCAFLDAPTIRWTDAPPPPSGRLRAFTRQIVVADFPARALDAGSLTECARILAGSVDAVLVGDSGQARVQFPPAYRAHLIQAEGVAVWAGVNCRDRNRVAIEGELAALAHAGVLGVHCVTGDHTGTGHRPDAQPVFDLDSTRVAALARAAGHLVSVAEAPATPPVGRRPERLREKFAAGAEVCFVNHAGGVAPVRDFIEQVGAEYAGFVPCVPAVFDRGSAALLRSFTTLVLPDGYLDGILAAADPRAAGIRAAAELAQGFLALDGVIGVNLSGGPGPGGEAAFAEALAELAGELSPAGTRPASHRRA